MEATTRRPRRLPDGWQIVSRLAAGLLGGYALTWGFAAAGIAALVAAGVDFHEAETGVLMVAFLVFLGALVWAFAAARPGRVWTVLLGGAMLLGVAASLLQHALLGSH